MLPDQMCRRFIVLILVGLGTSSAAQFSFELNVGNKYSSLSVKDFQYVDKGKRISFYSFTEFEVNYKEEHPKFYSLNALFYNFKCGIGLGSLIITGTNGLRSTAGVQFQKKLGSVYVYLLSTYELDGLTRQEDFFIWGYKQSLTRKLNFFFQNENYLSIVKWRYDGSFQRIKTGIGLSRTEAGLVMETSQDVDDTKTKFENFGIFIKQSF